MGDSIINVSGIIESAIFYNAGKMYLNSVYF